MIKLLGMTGRAGSGKDTAAYMLMKDLGYKTYALASPIKAIVNSMFGWGEDHAEGSLKEEELSVIFRADRFNEFKHCWSVYNLTVHADSTHVMGLQSILNVLGLSTTQNFGEAIGSISPRKAYQLVGTEWGRAINDTIWLDIATENISKGTIVTDVRFPNERDWLDSLGGKLIHVDRGGYTHTGETSHSSEAGLEIKGDDWVLYNKGSLEELRENVEELAFYVRNGEK